MCVENINPGLKKIFEKALAGSNLFLKREALSFDYVPDKLLFRENQIKLIAESLSPILRGSKPSNLILYGQTGTGKTATAKNVIKALQDASKDTSYKIKLCYINTRITGTEYRLLYELGKELNINIPFTGLAIAEVSSRIIEEIKNKELFSILILDEIDFLIKQHGDKILYEFTRVGERLSAGSLSIVGISNDLRFKEILDPRVISSLSEEEIVFTPYSSTELKLILEERTSIALYPNSVSTGAISLCAGLAGAEHGDARRAVDLLRISGEIAERENSLKIEENHVRMALKRIERDRINDSLVSLPIHAKLVLLSILYVSNNKFTGEIYEKYSSLSSKYGIETLTQRRISTLINELDLLGLISAKTISQGRYGRTKKITVSIQPSIIKGIFSKDPILGEITNALPWNL